MDITSVIQGASEKEFEEIQEAATPLEKFLFRVCREGSIQLFTCEMAPKGYTAEQIIMSLGSFVREEDFA